MELNISTSRFKLLLFSFFLSVVIYGFPLTNYSLSIDSESPIYPDFSLSLGRWGTNLVRYHIFNGHIPYFTLLLGLLFLSLCAVEMAKLFKLEKIHAYLFCMLFLSFPQIAYQEVFTMQADVVPLGFFLSVVAVNAFLKNNSATFSLKFFISFIYSAFLLMFVTAIYQALILIPIVCYCIYFLQSTYREDFNLKLEIRKGTLFIGLLLVSIVLYYISVKLLCPPVEGGYLSSYRSGSTDNIVTRFYTLWVDHLKGKTYYGERLFILASILSLIMLGSFILQKRYFVYRFLALFMIMLLPFIISLFITSGYNPPRIYVASGIVFAFLIVDLSKYIKAEKVIAGACLLIFLTHLYFITQLFYSNYRIYNHDKGVASKIGSMIQSKYPNFNPSVNFVYFYGFLPYEHHEKFRLPDSEVFGGSLFNWDNGSNYRIINFFKYTDVADYKMIDDKSIYLKIKDSIAPLPIWPQPESIRMIENVVVVKLGNEKGSPLFVE